MSVEETEEMMNEMVGMGILEKVIDERRIREEEKRRDLEEWGSEMTDEFNVVFEKLKLSRIDAAVITYGVSMALFRGILRDAKPGSKEEKEALTKLRGLTKAQGEMVDPTDDDDGDEQ